MRNLQDLINCSYMLIVLEAWKVLEGDILCCPGKVTLQLANMQATITISFLLGVGPDTHPSHLSPFPMTIEGSIYHTSTPTLLT